MSVSERVRALFSGIERYLWDSREMDLALNLAQELALQVPVIRLTCQPDTDAVYTLQNYLTQGGLSCDL